MQVLRTRIISRDSQNYPISAQHLFKTNDKFLFDMSSFDKYIVKSIDAVVGGISDEMTSHILTMIPMDMSKTMQLSSHLNIVVNGRYEVAINLDVIDGLANGASGTVEKVQLAGNSSRASGTVLMLYDDDKVGAKSRTSSKHMYKVGIDVSWTPIQPVSRQFQVGRSHNAQVIRKQFPLDIPEQRQFIDVKGIH